MKIALIMPGRSQIKTVKGKPWLPACSLYEIAGIVSATDSATEIVMCDELSGERLNPQNLPRADWYWISGYTPSRLRAYELASMIRGLGYKVLGGGMDVTGQHHDGAGEELIRVFGSYVVGILTSELCARLLQDFHRDELQPLYQATACDIPEWIISRHNLIIPDRQIIPGVYRSSRGCRHRCPFCSVHLMYPNLECIPPTIFEQTLPMLQKSLVQMDYADDYGGDPDYIKEVVLPIRKRFAHPWLTETSAVSLLGDSKHPGLLGVTSAAGCIGYFVGIESRNSKVSDKSLPCEGYEELVRAVHGEGSMILSSLILDRDPKATVESVQDEIHWAVDQKFDFAQFSLLSAHVGTKSRELALKHNFIIDDNPEHYDGAWPTVAHPNLSPKDQIELLQYAYRTFYSPANIGKRLWANHAHRKLILGAYRQIVASSSGFWKSYNYDYWQRTRVEPT